MKYPLDFESTFEKSLLFWLSRFIRNKTTSLSNSNITDQTKMAILIKSLINDIRSIDDLTTTAKELRKIGMNGLNVYYTPLEKLYHYLVNFGASSMKEIDEETEFIMEVSKAIGMKMLITVPSFDVKDK